MQTQKKIFMHKQYNIVFIEAYFTSSKQIDIQIYFVNSICSYILWILFWEIESHFGYHTWISVAKQNAIKQTDSKIAKLNLAFTNFVPSS